MSNEEKKRRADYKKRRDIIIRIQLVIIAIVSVVAVTCGILCYQKDKTYYIDYVESMVTIRVKEWNLVEMYQISI